MFFILEGQGSSIHFDQAPECMPECAALSRDNHVVQRELEHSASLSQTHPVCAQHIGVQATARLQCRRTRIRAINLVR
eukprot:6484189-Amphidinium_carterae.1